MSLSCVYDNPVTLHRELWRDGKIASHWSREEIERFANRNPLWAIEWQEGRVDGDLNAVLAQYPKPTSVNESASFGEQSAHSGVQRKPSDWAIAQIADALDCFWNAALGATHSHSDVTANAVMAGMVQGFAAVSARLREFERKHEQSEPSDQAGIAHVRSISDEEIRRFIRKAGITGPVDFEKIKSAFPRGVGSKQTELTKECQHGTPMRYALNCQACIDDHAAPR